jgi:DNA adenine methylase
LKKTKIGPLRWYGGKCQLVKHLLPLIPEHKTYVEVFAGGAALFFAKEKSPVEVLNDLNSGLVEFYRVLRNSEKFNQFQLLVELTPYSREEYCDSRASWEDCEDDVERAVRWFVAARQCFSGVFGAGWSKAVDAGSNGISSTVSRYLSAVKRLPEVHERLRGVQIENGDFLKIIKNYDRSGTFFYLDPPYVTGTRRSKQVYQHEMTDEDHEELVEMLLGIKGKAMLSGYAHPIYGPLECAGWKRIDINAKCTAGASTIKKGGLDKEAAKQKLDRVETVWLKDWSSSN